MTPEEAQAFSQGEFRGKVLTSLASIQSELTDHKKHHNGSRKNQALKLGGSFGGGFGGGAGVIGILMAILEKT